MTANRTPATRNRGFTLMHMIVAISLLAIFSTVAGHLLLALTARNRDSMQSIDALDQWQGIEWQLRADVWDSSSIELAENGDLRIEMPERLIVWRKLTDRQILERSVGEANRHYVLPAMLQFEVHPSGLLVHAGSNDAQLAAEQMLVMLSVRHWLKESR